MYAVVETGGKQYKVAQGDRLRVEKLNAPIGENVELTDVRLLSSDDGGITIAHDALQSARVVAEVLNHGRAKKIKVFKMKRRKNYHRTYGHRQGYTEIAIREIQQ